MSRTMKALVSYAPYDNRYEDFPVPEIGKGELLLKVKGCGICAGDVKSYHGGIRIWGTSEENRYIEAPCIGGHEFYGEIVEKAEDVTGYEVGEVITAEQVIPCGECKFCREGKYWMCTRSAVFGFKQYANGGFAEYVKIDKNCIKHRIPEGFTQEQAVLVEPIACGMHALERADIKHSDVVVIAGLGAIGLSMVNIASLYLPGMVIGIDVKENRLAMGKEFGADVVLNPAECNVAEEIMKLTDGLGCDVYVEASGSPGSVTQGMDALKNLGRYVQMGVFAKEVQADWNVIGDGKELTIIGSHLSALTYPAVIKGIQKGLIRTEGLISHRFKLEDWEEAFETAEKAEDAVKVMLVPQE
ncbi:zinc-binding dehydrogenase [Robinsoniella peoriensis]|uniref:D-arabitol-phosphate dehydrogenase n=1 Tax=Robinsoniella peoriensis TaxID=180332 RepID=A0A4U8Q940_9FIRM|nr:alcohol dehydrogenase catalytic domain-containing protein [Robinsoniella peoriensis]TLD01427.1 D-arabitol-phosphate dehydrogenase [Robinsoniella peoriensis]